MNGEDFSGIRDVGISGSLLLVDGTVARLGPAICGQGGAELGRSTRSSTCSSGGMKGARGFPVELVGSSVLLFPCLRGVFVLRRCRGSIGRGCWETLGASASTKTSCRPLRTSGPSSSRAGADPMHYRWQSIMDAASLKGDFDQSTLKVRATNLMFFCEWQD